MRNLNPASRTTPPSHPHGRLARLLFLLAALLMCGAGLARAQEVKTVEGETLRRPVLNVRPFKDLALRGKQLAEQGKLNADTVIDASATAERMEDGRLRPESVQVVWNSVSDETAASLSQQLLTALSESRVLSALEGAKTIQMGLKLDRQNVSVSIAAEMPSTAEAENYAVGYDTLATYGKLTRRGLPEEQLYKRLRFTSEGKMFKMSFEMPRDEATRLIGDMLAKKAAKDAGLQE